MLVKIYGAVIHADVTRGSCAFGIDCRPSEGEDSCVVFDFAGRFDSLRQTLPAKKIIVEFNEE
jgi:hypothetical protein